MPDGNPLGYPAVNLTDPAAGARAADLAVPADRLGAVPAVPPAFDPRAGHDLIIPTYSGRHPPRVRTAISNACAIHDVHARVASLFFVARRRDART